ncbi:MAG: fluoride efflux transporter CrcB [Phycisphaerae bacterium]|nr:fluoride efflux transporter CrcB [Phycisphaerae bacterium]
MKVLMVGFGGFLGATARYLAGGWLQRRWSEAFPAGTLVINVAGCLLIGVAMVLIEQGEILGPRARVFWTVGFLGAMTTFSTFGYETLELLRSGNRYLALANVLLNVVLGLTAVAVGRTATRAILG